MKSKIQLSFILTNIKNTLLVVAVCVDDMISKPFNSCLGEDTIYNFINSIIKESKYCTDIVLICKKELTKNLQ